MTKRLKTLCLPLLLIATLGFYATCASAADLIDVYHDALQNDPTFAAAGFTKLATKEDLPQAISALLPQIIGTADLTRSDTSLTVGGRTALQPDGTTGTTSGTFTKSLSNGAIYTMLLTQPLFDIASWQQVHVANNDVKQAYAEFGAAAQNLLIRTAAAYFTVLETQDTLRFTESEKRANQRQLEQAQQRYKVGLDAITTVYNAQAAYDATVAEVIAAKNNIANAKESLREITGKTYSNLATLKEPMPLLSPKPRDVAAWVDSATKNNFTLDAARYQVLADESNIKVQNAGHFPVVDAIAQYQDTETGRFSSASSRSLSKEVGLDVTMPFYEGGLVVSQTRQAKYQYETDSANLDGTYRSVVVSTRQSYNNITSGISKIKADREAVISAQSSLKSTEAAYKVGTLTIIDVLNVQRDLFEQQNTLAIDQYKYINDSLELKEDAGSLSYTDLEAINTWLKSDKRFPNTPAPTTLTHPKPIVGPGRHEVPKIKNVFQPIHHIQYIASNGTSKNSPTSSSNTALAQKAKAPSKAATQVAKTAVTPSKATNQVAKKTAAPSKTNSQVAKKTTASGKTNNQVAKKTATPGKTDNQVAKKTTASGKTNNQVAKKTATPGKTNNQVAKKTTASGKTNNQVAKKSATPGNA